MFPATNQLNIIISLKHDKNHSDLGFIFTSQALADNLKVIDGDTIVLNGEKIRFAGIDAAEYKQDCMNGDLIIYCDHMF